MRKYKLSELKNLVRCGMVHDLTNATAAEVIAQWRRSEKSGIVQAYMVSTAG